jgi:hypothetical protein
MSLTQQTDTPPNTGWLVDLNEKQKQNLAGAMVNVFWNLRATTGLLIKIEDGIAHLFRSDQGEFIEYQVAGTRYERVPGTPMRPALAHGLDYQYTWQKQRDALTNDEGDAINQDDYDDALATYEQGLVSVYDDLICEASCLLFTPSAPEKVAS